MMAERMCFLITGHKDIVQLTLFVVFSTLHIAIYRISAFSCHSSGRKRLISMRIFSKLVSFFSSENWQKWDLSALLMSDACESKKALTGCALWWRHAVHFGTNLRKICCHSKKSCELPWIFHSLLNLALISAVAKSWRDWYMYTYVVWSIYNIIQLIWCSVLKQANFHANADGLLTLHFKPAHTTVLL